MKKTVACMMMMAVVAATVFFYAPVNAATVHTRLNYVDRYYTSATNSATGIFMEMTLTEFYPESDSGMAYGTTAELMITARIYNPSSQDGFVYLPYINIVFDAATSNPLPMITGIENDSPDLYLGDNFNNAGSLQTLRILPSAAYNRGDGVVIPAGKSLYLVSQVTVNCAYDVSGNTIRLPVLNSISIAGTAFSVGDFTYAGEPIDLSPIITDINAIENNTDNIEQLLSDIKDRLVWSGQGASPGYNPTQNIVLNHGNTGLQYFSLNYTVYTGNSYISQYDMEFPDYQTQFQVYERVVPITLSIQMENYYQTAVANNGGTDPNSLHIMDLLPRDNMISYVVASCSSDVFQNPRIVVPDTGNYVELIFDYKLGDPSVSDNRGFFGLVPTGMNYSTFTILAYVRNTAALVLNSSFTKPDQAFISTNLNIDSDLRITVGQIQDALNQPSQSVQDNSAAVNNDADQVAQQMQNVHQQEVQYFQDNQDAIAATGLNNFQFNQNHISAFTMITTQFTELWNALSDYTLVFIFTLLLSLATYIIKHEPTTKVKQYRSSVAAERAERISYYGKKNAQARAMQSGHDTEFWDAVRRINS